MKVFKFILSVFSCCLQQVIRFSCLLLLSGFLSFLSADLIRAQTIPIDDIKEEQLRIQQLFHGSTGTSMTNRPVWNHTYDATMGLGEENYGFWSRKHKTPEYNLGYSFRMGVYKPSIQITTNSDVPYGDNNEAAWYGKGFNAEFKGGLWLTSDYLTVTFRPQLVNQENAEFEVPRFIPTDQDGNHKFVAEGIGDIIDRPFRYGHESFNTFSFGYTSIRAHYRQFEAGIGNEPLWWGGNVKYPLLMSNNAPGMRHFFVGTREPFSVPYVGKFEFKWLGAFPQDSDFFDANEEQDRFMSGININWSPSIAPNLHFGLARVVHTYLEDGLSREDLGMIFDPFMLENFLTTRGPLENLKPRNHLNSIYARWVWPESRFELYGEFYREDFAWDSRDLLMEPRHNSGYAFGFQKLVMAPVANFYRINLEFTNMTPSYIQEVRPQNYYYTHPEIRQGHTHRGQVLGAAIGPGSNSQFLSIDGYTDNGRFGLFLRRLADNNHFHYQYDRMLNRPEEWRQGYGDYWRNRTDLTIGTRALYNYREFLISSEFAWTKLFNYGRFDYGQFGGLNIANFESYDISNVQFQLSVTYIF